jgi:hypothetical protein
MVSLYTLTRGYYSTVHNLMNAGWMLLYPLALWGLWRHAANHTVQLIAAILLLQTLLVGLTHDEWSGRFAVPLLPWIMALATLAFGPRGRE